MRFSKAEILTVPHSQEIGFSEVKKFSATGVSTDSRTVKTGDIFIAIRGAKFDGHNFVSRAAEIKAACVIVERRWSEANPEMMVSMQIPRLVVENSVHALGHLAGIVRCRHNIPFIAIGGSNGKTTTKEMISSVLAKKYRVLSTQGNLNNHIGVPQTLFRLGKKYQAAVIEIGTNHPGEIRYLCSVLRPTHGLITNIGAEHLEFFGSIDGVAKAEGELFEWLEMSGGTMFVNTDDRFIERMARKSRRAIRYGFSARRVSVKGKIGPADSNARMFIRIKPEGKKAFGVKPGAPGKHNAYNALAAAAVGVAMKVPGPKICDALSSFSCANKRMQIHIAGNVTILNDTYNSNPDSVLAALATVKEMKSAGRRIAVLADMLELGSRTEELHRQVGTELKKNNIDVLLTYGPSSKYVFESAEVLEKRHCEGKEELVERLLGLVSPGDIVLVKGSRGMKMEEVAEALQEHLNKIRN
jgi:UDP-N-acetylmuramoyl-tripeptide--D-alanyl-D-alanine ligase